MKILKKLIFTLIIIIPINVNAGIIVDCDGPAKINQRISCDIKTDVPISSFKSTLVVDPVVTYEGSVASTNFVQFSSGRYLNFQTANPSTYNQGLIAYLYIIVPNTSKSSFTLSFKDIEYTSSSGDKQQSNISETVQIMPVTTKTTSTTSRVTTQSSTEKTFTVTLNPNNNTDNKITKCTTKGSNCKIDLSDIQIPTKNGFTYNGWGNAPTCTEGSKTSYTASADVTLYACWLNSETDDSDNDEMLYLQSLSIEGQDLDFSKFKTDYDLVVLYQVENLVISASPAKEGVTVDLQETYPLLVGENTISIKLSDENQNTTTYTINVKRLKEGEEIRIPSSDATLKNIIIKGYDLDFKSDVFDYILKVPSGTKSLDVKAVLNNEYAEYVITGNNDIYDGSIISIKVKAEIGDEINSYDIKIEVVKGIKDYLLYIVIGSVLLISIIALVIINQSKIQKKKTTKQNIAAVAPAKKTPTKINTIKTPVVKPIPVPKPVSPQPAGTPQTKPPEPATPQPAGTSQTKPPEPKETVEVLDL